MKKQKIDIIAHRGASGSAPENTLASIKRAISIGAKYIEIDVRLTKDPEIIVLHDPHLKGIFPLRAIRHMTLEEALEYDVGTWFGTEFAGEQIPTLAEVITLCGKQATLMVEIKREATGPKVISDAIFNILGNTAGLWDKIIIGSFSAQILKYIQNHIKNSKDGFEKNIEVIGIAEKIDQIDVFLEMGLCRLALWHKLITSELMEKLRDKGIIIWVFTVNTRDLAKKLAHEGVDGLITDFPEILQSLYQGYE